MADTVPPSTSITPTAGSIDVETAARSRINNDTSQQQRQRHRTQQRPLRSRRAVEIANEIKSTANGSSDTRSSSSGTMESMTNDTNVSGSASSASSASSSSTSHLTPEIISKIKQFYSGNGQTTSRTPRATAAVTKADDVSSATTSSTSASSVYDYCQRFVSDSYHLDANTTAAVCDILLLDDTASPHDTLDGGIDTADGVSDSHGFSADDASDGYMNDDTADASQPQRNASGRIHMAECLMAVKWFALFDFIIANGMTTTSSHKTTTNIPAAVPYNAPEFMLLPYDAREPTRWSWPPLLRVPIASNFGSDDSGIPTTGRGTDGAVRLDLTATTVNWVMDGLQMFGRCGSHCWTVTFLVVLMLSVLIVSSVVAVIAMR